MVQPALTRVSKLTRDEALPIYYSENQFGLCIPEGKSKTCKDKWYRTIKMFRVFAAGGTGGPGTSWLRFIRRIMVSCEALAHDSIAYYDQEYILYVAEPFALAFVCGRRGPRECGDNSGCDMDGCDSGRLERLLSFPLQRPIGDLKDKEAVLSALQDAVNETDVEGDMDRLVKALPLRRVVDALHMVVQECPEASRQVELSVTVPCPVREHHVIGESDLELWRRSFDSR